MWGNFPGIIPFCDLLVGGFNNPWSREKGRKGFLAFLGIRERKSGDATEIGDWTVVFLCRSLNFCTIDLNGVGIDETQAGDGAVLDTASAEMAIGQLGFCHIVLHRVIYWLIGIFRHRLDMEHHGMLVGHGVQME